MTKPIALIVADDPSRRTFLEQCFSHAGMATITYPNPGAYVNDLDAREPQVLVVDLSLPVEIKLGIVGEAIARYPKLKVITIGKRAYLEQENVFAGQRNVAMCDRIEELAL